MRIENLNATSQKSYYGKALIKYADNGDIILQSYDTDVCKIENGKFIKLWDGYSLTTMNHIKDFCIAFEIPYGNKKWWCELPCESEGEYKVEYSNGFFSRKTGATFDSFEQAEREVDRIMTINPRLSAYVVEV